MKYVVERFRNKSDFELLMEIPKPPWKEFYKICDTLEEAIEELKKFEKYFFDNTPYYYGPKSNWIDDNYVVKILKLTWKQSTIPSKIIKTIEIYSKDD